MSIIQNIRDKGAWIIFTIIVIALVAFVLQDGIGKQGNTTVTDLGSVNGVNINKINFNDNAKGNCKLYILCKPISLRKVNIIEVVVDIPQKSRPTTSFLRVGPQVQLCALP